MTEREEKIINALRSIFAEPDEVKVEDTAGDQEHFRLTVVSSKFEGLNRVAQQRLVYEALGPLAREIHAFEFRLSAP